MYIVQWCTCHYCTMYNCCNPCYFGDRDYLCYMHKSVGAPVYSSAKQTDEVHQWLRVKSDFMLHMVPIVFHAAAGCSKVGYLAEEVCSLSPAAPHLTAYSDCSFLYSLWYLKPIQCCLVLSVHLWWTVCATSVTHMLLFMWQLHSEKRSPGLCASRQQILRSKRKMTHVIKKEKVCTLQSSILII